jgi:dienelactone hydrolase
MNPYSYTNDDLPFQLELRQTTRHWSRYSVDFPTAHPTRYEENNTVRGEYFQPKNADKAPLVILLHGMGDDLLIPSKFLARALAKKGIACFMMYSVFHSKRRAEPLSKRLPTLTPEDWFESYRISVIDTRKVVDWASQRGELNDEKIGLVGISFGGFVSSIAMGVDERIKAGIFIISGGNSAKINQRSRKGSLKYKRPETEYNRNQSLYAQYLAEVAERGFEEVTPASQSFLVDPMTFTSYLRKRPILMLNALWDEYIPREAAQDFWKACDRPAITWYPATHAAIWLWYPFLKRKVTRFFGSTFQNQDGHLR